MKSTREGLGGQSGKKGSQGLVWMLNPCSPSPQVKNSPVVHFTGRPGWRVRGSSAPLGAPADARPRGPVPWGSPSSRFSLVS